MTLQNGQVLGERYRLDEPVPGTGDRTVHLAVDEWSGHRVLLTLVPVPADLPPERAAALRRRVGQEVARATGVRHLRAGRVLGVVTDPARGLWVAGETRAGFRTLRAVRDAEGGVLPGRVARWGGDVADGLAALHGEGLTHRGVCAELVAVFDDGSAGLMSVAATGDTGGWAEADAASDAARRADVRALASMLRSLLPSNPPESDAAAVDGLRRMLLAAESDERISAAALGADLARSVNAQPTSAGVEPVRGPDVPAPRDETTTRLERDPPDRALVGPPTPAGPAVPGPVPLPNHPPPAGLGPHDPTSVLPPPGVRSRTRARRAWVVAAVVVVVGAVIGSVAYATTGGDRDTATQQPATQQPAPSAAPAGLLGDPATVDPCGLLSTASFRRFGAPQMFDDFGPYYTCSVDIDRSGGSVLASVYLYAPGEVAVGGGSERIGELVVTRRPASGDSCSRQIALPDGSAVQVRASASGPPPADLCAVADAGTATAVSTMNSRGVARRAPDPADPLFGLDMCSLTDRAAGGRIAGLDTARITPGFGSFSCSMGYDPAFRNAGYAVYTANRRLPLEGTRTTVGRHSGVVTSYPKSDGYPPSCSIALVQRSFAGSSGAPRVGLVEVKLYGSAGATTQQICDGARTLALAAETRLPAPQ